VFSRHTSFSEAVFTGNADFEQARFEREVVFVATRFLGAAAFRETLFRHDQELLPGPIFCLAGFDHPEAIEFYKTRLDRALFYNCDVSEVNFSLVEWMQRPGSGKRMVFEEVVTLNPADDLRPIVDSLDQRHYVLIAELYQQLIRLA
jgi:hypothetical protein